MNINDIFCRYYIYDKVLLVRELEKKKKHCKWVAFNLKVYHNKATFKFIYFILFFCGGVRVIAIFVQNKI